MSKGRGRGGPPRHVVIDHKDIWAVFEELETSDERTAAIVAGSMVENYLALAIQARLIDLTPSQQKELFDHENSVLNTFHAKIQLGFALGLFGAVVKNELGLIKKIRNTFAHHIFVKSFDHAEVNGHCDELFGPTYLQWGKHEPNLSTRRYVYLETAFHLIIRFDMERGHLRRPLPSQCLSYELVPPASPEKSD